MLKAIRLLLLLPLMSMTRCAIEPAPPFTLPAITSEGANTFGLKVNGRTWRNFDGEFGGRSDGNLYGRYDRRSGSFELNAQLVAKDIDESFMLQVDSLRQPGTYVTTYPPDLVGRSYAVRRLSFRANEENLPYVSEERGSVGSITITALDTVQHIVSGTFSGTLNRTGARTQSVNITEGRFDLRYY
jgi:hypothetical protein